ncbi:hypothetical protein [Allosphingosinicella sp.]|jgi:predicted component of type VI protein secretion system|uniref:hypothetical protein n=1 Tax=Allosphingosinicella sp. TaxID=2823234 RepID=UPI002EF5999B
MIADRTEQLATGAAVAGHAALLAALYYFVPDPEAKPVAPPPAMEVSFVDEVGAESAAATTQPSAASFAPELGAPAEAAPEPAEQPTPEPTARPIPEPAAQPRPSPRQAAAEPRPAAEPRGDRTGRADRGSRIGADLLKGLGDEKASTNRQASGETYGAQERASVRDIIRRALLPCERQPLTTPPEANVIRVRVDVVLDRDGSVASVASRVVESNPRVAQYESEMVRAARRVVAQCSLRELAARYPQFYDVRGGWRSFPYVFPRSTR